MLTETVWINAATHLPVRVALSAADGRVLASQTFAWLAPDQANLAVLSPAPVPAGFRQTSGPPISASYRDVRTAPAVPRGPRPFQGPRSGPGGMRRGGVTWPRSRSASAWARAASACQ